MAPDALGVAAAAAAPVIVADSAAAAAAAAAVEAAPVDAAGAAAGMLAAAAAPFGPCFEAGGLPRVPGRPRFVAVGRSSPRIYFLTALLVPKFFLYHQASSTYQYHGVRI